jgi:serine protease Do
LCLLLILVAGCSRQTSAYPDFADLVEKVNPSVVNISTVAKAEPPVSADAGPGGDPSADATPPDSEAPEWFRRFMEEHGLDQGDEAQDPGSDEDGPPPAAESLGSGFILWEDGYVLTNFHVVRDAGEIVVRLLDRREFTAKLVGTDERSDLALLKIDARDLPAVKTAETRELRPGQWVLAIGSPFGFDYSVTAGIVSAKGRNLITEQYVPFIQSDVAINPGNSGGPLFNLDGEVVGINSQIYSQSGSYMGVSFSIPIDVAVKVARQLRDTGSVKRGWVGVIVQEVTRNLAQSFQMDKPVGALVARVVAGGPADMAGIRAGDVILSFNGEPLLTSSNLPPLVGSVDPGQIVPLEVLRDGKTLPFKLEVGELRNQDREYADGATGDTPGSVPDAPAPQSQPALGLVVRSMSDEERRKAQVFGRGVWVEQVQPGAGARAGLRNGDVIMTVAGQEVDSPSRFAEVVHSLTPGSSVPLLVSRNGVATFVPLEVPTASERP